jgi:hypothetical protein
LVSIAAGGGGGGAVCVAGLVVVEVFTLSNTLLLLLALPLKNKVDVMANTAITEAKIQVPFSSTSVVCFTPMKLLLKPPTLAFNPPPFGFWINTMNPKAKQATTINIKKKVIICYFLNVLYGMQNKRIFQEK